MTSPFQNHPCRVILLLDLDCFYAQCERVRLGLDNATTSLALLQWDSVLAVTYPAREKYDIKRGDSWDQVSTKSDGKCLAIHLPLLTAGRQPSFSSDAGVEEAYEQEFELSFEERDRVLKQEVGRRRQNSEGKACLERYRLASTRIFGVVVQALEERLNQQVILERASIDELFIDVTNYCWDSTITRTAQDEENIRLVMKQTCIVAQTESYDIEEDDPSVIRALSIGAWVASSIRAAVLDQLGFTLSAGISTSKLTAKLGASYGKPNGQAVILPSRIPAVMATTKISKCRSLGGKIGKAVGRILPEGVEHTMGSVAKHLSLPMLVQELGPSFAQLVFDAARGTDVEVVKSTHNALVKSITAFKSFFKTREIDSWLMLLATDIMRRVETDSRRNHRFPKTCTIHYTYSDEHNKRNSKSLRVSLPKETDMEQKVASLVQRVKNELLNKEGDTILFHRLGLCAMNFEERIVTGSIATFFKKSPDEQAEHSAIRSCASLSCPNQADSNYIDDEELARLSQQQEGFVIKTAKRSAVVEETFDKDLELARKLQQQYDREHTVLAVLDRRPKKKQRIDSFFKQCPSK